MAGIARDSGIAHLVHSSVGGAERRAGIDHFETKAEIERHILATGLPATIPRPVFFMNSLLHHADAGGERLLSLPVKPMRFITGDAFDDPGRFIGRQIELGGDAAGWPQACLRAELANAETPAPARRRSLRIAWAHLGHAKPGVCPSPVLAWPTCRYEHGSALPRLG